MTQRLYVCVGWQRPGQASADQEREREKEMWRENMLVKLSRVRIVEIKQSRQVWIM